MFLSQVMSLASIGAEDDEFENEKKKLKRAGVKNKWAFQTYAAIEPWLTEHPNFRLQCTQLSCILGNVGGTTQQKVNQQLVDLIYSAGFVKAPCGLV